MDVQAAAPTLSSTTFTLPPLPGYPGAGAPEPIPSGSNSGAVAPVAAPDVSAGSNTGLPAPDPSPGLALLPPAPGTPGQSGTGSLPGNVAKLVHAPVATTEVSFQPSSSSNEIVTVVTDKATGKVIVQFPSETLIALAQFFHKLDSAASNNGAVLDKKA